MPNNSISARLSKIGRRHQRIIENASIKAKTDERRKGKKIAGPHGRKRFRILSCW